MGIHDKLMQIQSALKAPKGQFNSFGKYHYRSCEDILEGVKPHLKETNTALVISDEIVLIGERYYLVANVKLIDTESGESVSVQAMAREEENKKGMDSSQLTGATSSYARKYALNGLFCIDDTKDSDATNTHGKEESKQPTKSATPVKKDGEIPPDLKKAQLIQRVADAGKMIDDATKKELFSVYKKKSVDQLTVEQLQELHDKIKEVATA